MSPSPGTQKLGRARRLRGRRAFARVFGARRSAANKLLVVYGVANGLDYPRVGLTVGRRHGNAVHRNKIKRLLREAFRLESDALPCGYDWVCIPQVGAKTSLEAYRRAMCRLATRIAARTQTSPDNRDA